MPIIETSLPPLSIATTAALSGICVLSRALNLPGPAAYEALHDCNEVDALAHDLPLLTLPDVMATGR